MRLENTLGLKPQKYDRPIFHETFLHFNGKTQNLCEWAKELGIKPKTLYVRLERGWSVERALTAKKNVKKYDGKSLKQLEAETGIERHALWKRYNRGKPENRYKPLRKKSRFSYKPKNIRKGCIYPDCFHCPFDDCITK